MQGEISQNVYSGNVFTRRDVLKWRSRSLERLELRLLQIRVTIRRFT